MLTIRSVFKMHMCKLVSVSGLPAVTIPDGQTFVLGRSKETKIKSTDCSRTQLELTPHYTANFVIVTQVGPNPSGINNEAIGHGLTRKAKDRDIINVILDDATLNYQVVFPEAPKITVQVAKDVSEGALKVQDGPRPVKIPKMFLTRNQQKEFMKEEEISKGKWEKCEDGKVLVYVYGDDVLKPKSEIIAFDMDGTLISTKSGKVFPKDEYDWKLLSDGVIPKIKSYIAEHPDSKFVIFTNQAWMQNKNKQQLIQPFKSKIERIVDKISLPVIVFIFTGYDEFRKPSPAVWNLLASKFNGKVEPDKAKSLYCGDAAGRKGDHSAADRNFAANVGISFCTPEEFFKNQKASVFEKPKFAPSEVVESVVTNSHIKFPFPQEMILMMGYPASGKSSFVKSHILPRGYEHVNRDKLKSASKCQAAAEEALKDGRSVVVDNTNPSMIDRKPYIDLARKYNVPIRCFMMQVDKLHAMHNNKFRELVRDDHENVPETAFYQFANRFKEPSTREGFEEIVQVFFEPEFSSDDRKEKYLMYLLEK